MTRRCQCSIKSEGVAISYFSLLLVLSLYLLSFHLRLSVLACPSHPPLFILFSSICCLLPTSPLLSTFMSSIVFSFLTPPIFSFFKAPPAAFLYFNTPLLPGYQGTLCPLHPHLTFLSPFQSLTLFSCSSHLFHLVKSHLISPFIL